MEQSSNQIWKRQKMINFKDKVIEGLSCCGMALHMMDGVNENAFN